MKDLRPELKHIRRKQQIKRVHSFGSFKKSAEAGERIEQLASHAKRSKSPGNPEADESSARVPREDRKVKVRNADKQINAKKVDENLEKDNKISNMIERVNTMTQNLMQTSQGYHFLHQRVNDCQRACEEALVYFDEEVMERMKSTVDLIEKVEKSSHPRDINSLKRKLMLQNLKKIQAKEGVLKDDIVAALGSGVDFEQISKQL